MFRLGAIEFGEMLWTACLILSIIIIIIIIIITLFFVIILLSDLPHCSYINELRRPFSLRAWLKFLSSTYLPLSPKCFYVSDFVFCFLNGIPTYNKLTNFTQQSQFSENRHLIH